MHLPDRKGLKRSLVRRSGEDKVVRLQERIVSNSDHRTFYGRDNYRKAQLVTMQRMTWLWVAQPHPTHLWQLPTPKAWRIAQKRGWETCKSQKTMTTCSEIFSVYGRGAVTYKISIWLPKQTCPMTPVNLSMRLGVTLDEEVQSRNGILREREISLLQKRALWQVIR